jgi:hypothetical protein
MGPKDLENLIKENKLHKTKIEIGQALARGYCSEKNKNKELDSDLIEAMVEEVALLLDRP